MQFLPERRLVGSASHPDTTLPAGIVATPLANSNSTCSPTSSPLPDSYPICPTLRSTVARHPPNVCPVSGKLCHPQSKPPPDRFSAWLAAPGSARQPASPHRPKARPPPNDAETDVHDEHCSEPNAPPSAQRSCVLRAITVRCSSSSEAGADLHAPRRWPGPQYMPRSASAVGLARRGVIPQNNSTSNCSFLTQ